MNTLKRITVLAVLLNIFFINAYAQDSSESDTELLEKIYSSLEYNTMAFDDLKENWIISDPLLVREIYNKFIVSNAIRVDGQKISMDSLTIVSKPVFEGNALITVRKRFYDDEIEQFVFIKADEIDNDNPRPLFDPITDGFYLREVVGNDLYTKIQEQIYFFRGVTKDDFNTDAGYFFDIKLDALEPEVMFWTTTSQERNKYLISAFGKWGNDRIFLPGWFFSEFAYGAKLGYYKQLSDNADEYTYSLWLGTTANTSKPFKNDLPQQPLLSSGKSVYFRFAGDPARVIFDNYRNLYLDFEMMLTFNEFKNTEIGTAGPFDFYAIRNYYVFSATQKNIVNLFDFGNLYLGAGYSTHNIFHYAVQPGVIKIVDLEDGAAPESSYDHHLFADLGLVRNGGLLQHEFRITYGNNLVRNIHYIGLKLKMMLNDSIGFDVRYITAANINVTETPWRTESYFVFSPVIRINY